MISEIEKTILDKLLCKYEKSKSFNGSNKVNQRFCAELITLFPRYADHSDFEMFQAVNESVDILVRKELITAKYARPNVYGQVCLETEHTSEAYAYCGRTRKKQVNQKLAELLEKYRECNPVLKDFCSVQTERLRRNRTIEYFNQDLAEFEQILICTDRLFKVASETYTRDFSVRLFRDSKAFDRIRPKVTGLLYQYGDFPEKNQVLESLNLIDNPTYVNFKGAGVIVISGQRIDLNQLKSDIAISSALLEDTTEIRVTGQKVVTIENLTSFHSAKDPDALLIYLGGFHNRIRREFIKRLYQQNPEISYEHFGDIDAGGFYILEHLRRMTGVDFKPHQMDLGTLKRYQQFAKQLTDSDRSRLTKLLGTGYDEVINYMLEHDVKLEQEAVFYQE